MTLTLLTLNVDQLNVDRIQLVSDNTSFILTGNGVTIFLFWGFYDNLRFHNSNYWYGFFGEKGGGRIQLTEIGFQVVHIWIYM